jgi:site-specific recombinase XerD
MPRKIKSNALETRTSRLKLPIAKKPVFVRVALKLSLGYRRNATAGTWVMRIADGHGGMITKGVAHADDYQESDGKQILSYYEAQDRCRQLANHSNEIKTLTVQECVDHYLVVLRSKNARTEYDCRLRLQKHFLPQFGTKLMTSLTKSDLDRWLSGLVSTSNDPEVVRKSKDSANRMLSMVKAVFNFALHDASNNLNDDAWRHLRPYKNVAQPRQIRYSDEQVEKIIQCAPDQSTRNLIKGAFLTGCRYGELASAKVSSVDLHNRNWRVIGKTGSRVVILQKSAVAFFEELVKDRSPDEFLFTRPNGERWKESNQHLPFKKALERASLPTDGSIYAMRHSAISRMIEAGIPISIVAENAGTSVQLVEKTYSHILAEKKRSFIERLDDLS